MKGTSPDTLYLAFYDSGDGGRDFTIFRTREEAEAKLVKSAHKYGTPCDTYEELLEAYEHQSFEGCFTWYVSVISLKISDAFSLNNHIEVPDLDKQPATLPMYLSVFISDSLNDFRVHQSKAKASARLVEVAHLYDVSCSTVDDLYLIESSPDFDGDWHVETVLVEIPARIGVDTVALQNPTEVVELLLLAQSALFSADITTFKANNATGMSEVRKMISNLLYTVSKLYVDHVETLDQVTFQGNKKSVQPSSWPPLTIEESV